jgi:hypothetical protein
MGVRVLDDDRMVLIFSWYILSLDLFLTKIVVSMIFPKPVDNHAENLKVAFALKGQ